MDGARNKTSVNFSVAFERWREGRDLRKYMGRFVITVTQAYMSGCQQPISRSLFPVKQGCCARRETCAGGGLLEDWRGYSRDGWWCLPSKPHAESFSLTLLSKVTHCSFKSRDRCESQEANSSSHSMSSERGLGPYTQSQNANKENLPMARSITSQLRGVSVSDWMKINRRKDRLLLESLFNF